MLIAALFTIARTWKQPRCPSIDEWIRIVVYIHNGILLSHKRRTFESVLMRWMNLEPIILSEVSQKDKDKYCILTHIYGSRKMVLKNLFTEQQWINTHREQTY